MLLPHAVWHESTLSFLGVGLSPDRASLGTLLSEARGDILTGAWWTLAVPAVALIATALAFAAVAVAPRGRRLRALSLAGLSLVLAMLVLAIALLIGRALYLDAMPPDILAPDAAAATIDTVLDPLRLALRAVAVLGLVVAVGAYLLGGSASATAVRRPRSGRRSRPPARASGRRRSSCRVWVIMRAPVAAKGWP